MELLLLILPLAGLALYLRLRVFETVFAVILSIPVFAFPLGFAVPPGRPVYALVLILLSAAAAFLQWKARTASESYSRVREIEPIAVFTAIFMFCLLLCSRWPDFFPTGERLRDYALLSSIIQSPVEPREPWFFGHTLNYYVFWYRMGHVFNSLFGIPVWRLYSILQSFTYAIFCASTYHIFRRACRFSVSSSIFCMILTGFGSNIEGIWSAFQGDDNWWGPSRVIQGAINEFPVWSFLLGDLHPHYLNLPALAFLLAVLLPALDSSRSQSSSLLLAVFSFIVVPLFLYNSNAWEVPLWGISAGMVALFLLIAHFKSFNWDSSKIRELGSPGPILVIVMILYSVISLFLSSRHLVPLDAPLTRVAPPILQSTTGEMFRHFGFPLGLIAISNVLLPGRLCFSVPAGILLAGTLIHSDSGVFLYALLLITATRLIVEYFQPGKERPSDSRLALEALGIASICLVLIPEFFFLNDAYGGESERMNTIFKFYTFSWLLLHLSAFYLIGRILIPWIRSSEIFFISKVFQIALLLVFLRFFTHTIPIRAQDRTEEAAAGIAAGRGLGKAEREFPGAAAAIRKLESLPKGAVIEAQGNPYSWTSHVSTLSGKESFLGWANHVELLNRDYGEINRRKEVTDRFYRSYDCLERRGIMEREQISYAVVGPLEQKQFPGVKSVNFQCLHLLIEEGEYRIYGLQ